MVAAAPNPYQQAVEATYGDLAQWQSRARSQPSERPERASDLDIDDRIFAHHPISEVARLSLVLSGEHLRLARDSLQAGEGYPSAHFTVLRGALVGAAQGVWVLSPGHRDERRERGLAVIAEIYVQLGKYYGELRRFGLDPEQREHLAEQDAWLEERKAEVSNLRTKHSSLDLTNIVIPQALDHTFPDRERRESGRELWRQMSADAHVLGWSLFQRASFDRVDRTSGLGDGVSGGSWRLIAQPFVASHKLLKEGWSLFDRRCEAP